MSPSMRPCCFLWPSTGNGSTPSHVGQKGIWGDFSAGVWLASCDQVHWHPGQRREQAAPGGLWVTVPDLLPNAEVGFEQWPPRKGFFKSASGVLEMALLAGCGEKAWSHSCVMGAPACWWGTGR